MGDFEGWLSLLLGGCCLGMLMLAWRPLRGTTLRAAWYWSIAAVTVIAGTEAALGFTGSRDGPDAAALRFAAAALLFCPAMALLGAKRPQNGAWQCVVVALWGVLALPALEIWMRGRGEAFSIDPVRSWFLAGLIILGVINHLPTRFAASAFALGTAQLAMFWPWLPWGEPYGWHAPAWTGLALALAALLGARFTAKLRTRHPLANDACPEFRDWSVVWRDFRDGFGVVWGMRVMERINAQAATCGWPVRLAWDGFVKNLNPAPRAAPLAEAQVAAATGADQPCVTPDQVAAIEPSLRGLLRRFVSPEWIDKRLVG